MFYFTLFLEKRILSRDILKEKGQIFKGKINFGGHPMIWPSALIFEDLGKHFKFHFILIVIGLYLQALDLNTSS